VEQLDFTGWKGGEIVFATALLFMLSGKANPVRC
jgi:hypothetical protein